MSLTEFCSGAFPNLIINDHFALREHAITDAAAFLHYFSKPSVNEFNIASPSPTSLGDAQDEINYCRSLYYEQKGIYWSLEQRDNHRMIGAIGIHFRPPACHGEIHYDLDDAFWGQGLMTQAMHVALTHCFVTQAMDRLEARTLRNNPGSIRVLEKCGFRFKRTISDYASYNGNLYNIDVFQLTARQYRSQFHQ